ncbi:type IV pilus biogenesis/stability protein PilW [Colwelliaceae bacterium MEBiC 14330]
MARYIFLTLTAVILSLLSGCVTQSFENNEPIVKTQANRDEMAATRISLGLGYLKMGNMAQAKLNLEKAKRFSPKLVQVHTAFAHYYETVGENQLAIESFEQALSIKADSADTLNNYGVFLCRQNKVEAAEKQFLKAIAVPSYLLVAQSYENLASCYLEINNFDKAEMYLNKAIFHSPNRTQTLLQMVRLQYAMGDYKEAKRFLQKFERNTQRFTADSLALAYKLFWKLGQRRTASNYANMLVKMYPQSWEAKQYLLNELEFIDADNLARKYQLSKKEQGKVLAKSSKKRVVKLSPNKVNKLPKAQPVDSTVAKQQEAMLVAQPTVSNITSTPSDKTNTAIVLKDSAALVSLGATNAEVMQGAAQPSDVTTVIASTTATEAELQSIPVNTTQSLSSSVEPTSTTPIPAKRDEPLPEALPVEVAVNSVEEETVSEISSAQAVFKESNDSLTDVSAAKVATKNKNDNREKISVEQAFHTVSSGENLYNISVRYNVKLKALRKWNNIDETNKIRIGEKLYVVDPQTVNND